MKTPIPEIPKPSQKKILALHHGVAYLTGSSVDILHVMQPEVTEDNTVSPPVAIQMYGDDIKRLYLFLKERYKEEEDDQELGGWKFMLRGGSVFAQKNGVTICMDTTLTAAQYSEEQFQKRQANEPGTH